MKLLKVFYLIPILGHLVREAVEGPDEAKLFFIVNVVMALAITVIIFGLPALIAAALAAAAFMFFVIIRITLG
jgi:hypothetical protein